MRCVAPKAAISNGCCTCASRSRSGVFSRAGTCSSPNSSKFVAKEVRAWAYYHLVEEVGSFSEAGLPGDVIARRSFACVTAVTME